MGYSDRGWYESRSGLAVRASRWFSHWMSTGGVDLVAEARNGEEAVRLAQEHRPRVVVMDVQMPGIDGVEATRQILHQAPDTRIVILTGGTTRELADAAIRAGAVAYVLKGREPDEIFSAILSATATW